MSLYDTKPNVSMYGDPPPESANDIVKRLQRAAGPRAITTEFRVMVDGAKFGLRVLQEWELLYLASAIDDEFKRRILKGRDQGLSAEHIASMVVPQSTPHFMKSGSEARIFERPVSTVHECPTPDGDLPSLGTAWECLCGKKWIVKKSPYLNGKIGWYEPEDKG